MTIEVYADELLYLTVEDIGDEIVVKIKDPENQKEEHLAHLRKLIDQRAETDQSRPVNAGELGDRLGRLRARESTPSSRSFSRTPSVDWEEEKRELWRGEQEAYRDLLADGGQPSHPISLGYDVIDNPEKYEQYNDILWFWHTCHGFHNEFFQQLHRWKKFREWQERMRKFYIPRNRFQEHKNLVRESQEELGCQWDLRVLEDRHQQNRLEDWNEFRAHYYRTLKAFETRIEPAEQELFLRQNELEDAQTRLTDFISDPRVLSDRLEDIVASERKIAEANSRVESAEKALQAAKQDMSERRAALVEIAQRDLHSAKADLEHASGSEEMRRLRDGSTVKYSQNRVVQAQGWLRAARLDVKRWGVFLKWIDEQYHQIAADCGYPTVEPLKSSSSEDYSKRQTLRPRPLRGKCAQSRSVLGPSSSTRVLKPSKGKTDRRQKRQPMCSDRSPPTTIQQQSVEGPHPPRRSKRQQQQNGYQPARTPGINILSSVQSSRVTKAKATSHTMNLQSAQSAERTTKQRARTKWGAIRRSQRIRAQKSGHAGLFITT